MLLYGILILIQPLSEICCVLLFPVSVKQELQNTTEYTKMTWEAESKADS